MHVAICDDNVADRKHLERLLSRESDKRMGTPNILYVDSYGDKNHFLVNPLKYNLVFMDMCLEKGTVEYILDALTAMGYNAPLILYSSKLDYRELPNLPDFVIHAKKPYIPEPLPAFLRLGDENAMGHIITISIHRDGVPFEAVKDELEYAVAAEDGTVLHFVDGTSIAADESIAALRKILEPYEEFERVNKNGVANFKFVAAVMPFHIIMQSYYQFKSSPLRYREFRLLKEETDRYSP
ncbi:MAG: hypothetical protein LUE96_01965 [Lachnospiraceae bacterium]|nr:hypothetical protein [Lachnospiraceae bacterium]